jgi:DDE_Tnp_1-associated
MLDSIYERLSKIQDKRDARGKRYKLSSILSLILLGYMQGCRSLAGVYRFGKTLNKSEKKKLGFTENTPSHPTITETLKLVEDSVELSKALEDIILQDDNMRHLAIDGKSIRSTHSNKNGMLHLVSLYSVDTCGVVCQIILIPS